MAQWEGAELMGMNQPLLQLSITEELFSRWQLLLCWIQVCSSAGAASCCPHPPDEVGPHSRTVCQQSVHSTQALLKTIASCCWIGQPNRRATYLCMLGTDRSEGACQLGPIIPAAPGPALRHLFWVILACLKPLCAQ